MLFEAKMVNNRKSKTNLTVVISLRGTKERILLFAITLIFCWSCMCTSTIRKSYAYNLKNQRLYVKTQNCVTIHVTFKR